MNKKKTVLRTSIATAVALTIAAPAFAATIDTFSGAGNTFGFATQLGQGAPAGVVTEGTNSFLRLVDGQNSENNHYSYDMTDAGAFDTITAMFDFRITPGTAGLADGVGFMLIPTANFGQTGDGPNPTAEEPNVANTFGLGLDVYPGINNVSTHWNGFQVNEANPAPTVSFRDNQLFNRVVVNLQRVGNGTNATVTLIPDSLNTTPGAPLKLMEITMPNMLPYESRAMFAARTGGENLKFDLDNVNVAYSNPFVNNLATAPTGHLFQDFDSAGTTGYRAVQASQTDVAGAIFRPGPLLKAAETGTKGTYMRVANDNVAGQSNRIVFDRAFDAGTSNATEVLKFDVRFNSTDQPADGLGLLFLPTKDPSTGTVALAGDGIASSEEPNHTGMLGIGFDVYPNGGTDVAPGVSLHWNGSKLADVALPASIGLNQFHQVQVIREPVANGINLSLIAVPDVNGVAGAPVTLFDKIFVPGATLYDYRVQFSGRTGGANADHDIDTISTSQIAKAAQATTQVDFTSITDSGWKAYEHGVGAPPEVKNDNGINGNYIRLIHDGNNSQLNSVAFDKQVDGAALGKPGLTAKMDFRMSGVDQSADGFSFMVIPTDTFGTTGPGASTSPGFIAEEPNVAGVFGIGFDLYDGAGIQFNEVSVHWNGGVIAALNIDPLLIDLDSGGFHRMKLDLRQSGSDMLLDLILTPDVFGVPGSPVTVFDDLLIPGMSLYDYRLELAGRSGGLNVSVDVDNIIAQTVPEPASIGLLAVGGILLGARRRRS